LNQRPFGPQPNATSFSRKEGRADRRREVLLRMESDTAQAGPGIAPSASLIRVQTFMLTTTPTISRISSGLK
jgi:hypothetical protein